MDYKYMTFALEYILVDGVIGRILDEIKVDGSAGIAELGRQTEQTWVSFMLAGPLL